MKKDMVVVGIETNVRGDRVHIRVQAIHGHLGKVQATWNRSGDFCRRSVVDAEVVSIIGNAVADALDAVQPVLDY